jgi:hypothetical protein
MDPRRPVDVGDLGEAAGLRLAVAVEIPVVVAELAARREGHRRTEDHAELRRTGRRCRV